MHFFHAILQLQVQLYVQYAYRACELSLLFEPHTYTGIQTRLKINSVHEQFVYFFFETLQLLAARWGAGDCS
jgi:hypothetical protein